MVLLITTQSGKPQSSHFNSFWTPAFAGVTGLGLFTDSSFLEIEILLVPIQMTLLRPLDIVLLVIITMAAAGSFFLMEKKAGSQAEIYVDNRKAASFNLDGPVQLKDITTKIGNVRVKYGDGSVQVTRSPCPQKICIRQGAISHIHENIICLPAQLQIVIVNEKNSLKSADGIDAISH